MAKITTVNYDKEKEKHDEVASRTYKGGSGVGSQSNIEKMAKDYINSNYESFTKGKDYASLEKRYSDQGRRAMDDTVGQVAARTGGLASSYAASAGQQAYGEYMGRLEDAARGLYDSQQAERLNKLGVAQGMQDRDFERWVAQRDFDLTAANNNIAHAQYMDSVADNNREQALSDFSTDVYMDMYLASDEDLANMTFEEYSKGKTAIPEGFDERDFETMKRQIMIPEDIESEYPVFDTEYYRGRSTKFSIDQVNELISSGDRSPGVIQDWEAIYGKSFYGSELDNGIKALKNYNNTMLTDGLKVQLEILFEEWLNYNKEEAFNYLEGHEAELKWLFDEYNTPIEDAEE